MRIYQYTDIDVVTTRTNTVKFLHNTWGDLPNVAHERRNGMSFMNLMFEL